MSRNLNNKDELTEFYQNDIFLRLVQINELVESIDTTIYSLKSVISGEVNEVVPGQSYGADRMQVTGDAISDIVNLVNKSSLSDYMTGLLDEKMKLIQSRSELKLRMSKIKQDINLSPIFIKNTEKKLDLLNKEYVELLVAAREMNRQNNKTLSQSLGSPHRAGSLIPKRGTLIILMSVLAGGFIAAVAALLMPDRQTTKS